MNIDIDTLEGLIYNFKIIIEKALSNYNAITDNFKFNFEINGQIEQMIIMSIFNFHQNVNSKYNKTYI